MERGNDETGVGSYTRLALHFATFCIRHKARTCNAHVHAWPVVCPAWHLFNFAHSQHALNDTAKHDMLAVEEFSWLRRDKKLGKYRYNVLGIHCYGALHSPYSADPAHRASI